MKKTILMTVMLLATALTVYAQITETLYLSGRGPDDAVQWDFWCSEGMRSGRWGKIAVPSCWEQQGYGGYTYGRYYVYDRESDKKWAQNHDTRLTTEQGRYRHRFAVPRQWQGRQVSIVFDAVMTDAEVFINGQPAGPVHQGGFYRFSYDVSDKLLYGKRNLLEVTVSKQSADKSVNNAERRSDWWLFGGIYRPVWLEAKPQAQIGHVAVDARADGTLTAVLRLKNVPSGAKVQAALTPWGKTAPTDVKTQPLTTDSVQTPTFHFQSVKPWDTEHPNLYALTLRLQTADGQTLHEVTERIGFRTIEFRPHDGIYLNDTKLLVKGTNRHCFDPETGRTLSHERNLQDARLIKQMNMNAVRSHYPPDTDFLDLCDSLGLLYLDELVGWQNCYTTAVGSRLVKEMIDRDVNHPCIFLWSNGNEGGFNTALDPLFALHDPQRRHVVHPWADFDELDCRHYPTMQDMAYRLDHGQRVFMMTEFLHGLYDRGQGAGLEGMWAKFRRSRLFAGGFIWAYVDEAIHRTDNGTMDTFGPNGPDGIVSAERRPLGSFYTVRQVWSPIQIRDFEASPRSFRGSFLVENGYMFSRLGQCSMRWQVVKAAVAGERVVAEGAATLPDIAPGEAAHAHFALPPGYGQGDVLRLVACDHRGDTVCTWSMPIKRPKEYFAENMANGGDTPCTVKEPMAGDSLIELSAAGVTATLSRATGLLTSLRRDGRVVPLTNGPLPVGVKATLRSVSVEDGCRVVAKYDGALDTIVWTMMPDGRLCMDALMLNYRTDNRLKDAHLNDKCRNLGLTFSYPESSVGGMRWMGRGPGRVWKNRLPGPQLGIWQKDYNNTVTGEYYYPQVYPEFKGYHADLYWATLQGRASADGTAAPSLTVGTETDGLFIRVFTAEEQRDREGRGRSVPEWPEGDLSFLLEIPSVNSQGADGDPSTVKIRKDDAGYRIKLWFMPEP